MTQMANHGNSSLASLYGLLEGMECEIQSALKAFLAKVREESQGLDSRCDEQHKGQTIVERAVITLTRILMTLKDNEKLKTPQYCEGSFTSGNTPSASVPGVTLAQVLARVEALEASMTRSQPTQSDLEEFEEKPARQDPEGNMRLLRQDMRELMERCHQLENKQNLSCLKEELVAVGKECQSRQSELEKKRILSEKSVVESTEKRVVELHRDLVQFKQSLASFSVYEMEIGKLREACEEIIESQNKFVLKKDLEDLNTRTHRQLELQHRQLSQQHAADVNSSASNLKRQILAVEANVEKSMSQMKEKLKKELLKSGTKQLEEAVTALENAILERMQQEELLSVRMQEVHSRAEQVEEKMLAVDEKMLRMEEQMKKINSKNRRNVARVTVQYAAMNSLVQSKIRNLEQLKQILNNVRDRSALGTKIDALENQVTNFSQRLGQLYYSPVAFSVRLQEDQVLKDNSIVKNLARFTCKRGDALDIASGVFTAPQDGLYVFGANLIKRIPGNGALIVQMLTHSSSAPSPRTILYLQANETQISCGGVVAVELRTNDKVYLKVSSCSDEMKLFQESCFCGWLVSVR